MSDTAQFGHQDPALPKAGVQNTYTLEEMQEILKCKGDPVYFIRKYMKIINVDKGLIPFDMYSFQEEMIRSFHENRFNITMCSRQVGKSTTVVGYFLYYILFNLNVRVCISANKQKTSADLLNRLKLAYENLPAFLKHGVIRWARLEVELSNGSSAFAAATSSSAVRGGSYNILLLDEFAFVPDNIANEFYASTYPTITSGTKTKLIMVSTPNGMNLFHKFWVGAKSGKNDFKAIFAHWSQVPGQDEAWKEVTMRNIGGPEKFAQEYDCSFLSTAYTLIKSKVLQELTFMDPIDETTEGYQEYVPPYKIEADDEPEDIALKERIYLMTVDTGNGQGQDFSTFVIFDVTQLPYRIVATYANNKITTMEFPQVIMKYAKRYHTPWLMLEVMDIGRDVAFILSRDHEYPKLMVAVAEKRLGQRLVFNSQPKRHLGLRMTAGVKRSGCAVLKTLVENNQLVINDYRVIQELSTFVQRGATFVAEVNHHDDLVMPLVVLGWISLQPNFAEITNVRALDHYTQIPKHTVENPVPANRPKEDMPMPPGMFGFYTEDDDPYWLIR